MSEPLIVAVIPIHNRWVLTEKLLESLKGVTYPNLQLVFVDDGSTDGSAEMIRSVWPDAIILKGDGNLFWTAAINLGVREALRLGAHYVLTLNNDDEVTPDFLFELLAASKLYPDALLGAKILFFEEPKRFFASAGKVDWSSGKIFDMTPCGEFDEGQFKNPVDVDFFTGACVLIPRRVFEVVGLYDEKALPHYHADSDFSIRAKRAGFRLIFVPSAVIYNHVSSSGLLGPYVSMTYQKLFGALFSIRSSANLRAVLAIHFRHCPWPRIVPSLIRFYCRVYAPYVINGFRRIRGVR